MPSYDYQLHWTRRLSTHPHPIISCSADAHEGMTAPCGMWRAAESRYGSIIDTQFESGLKNQSVPWRVPFYSSYVTRLVVKQSRTRRAKEHICPTAFGELVNNLFFPERQKSTRRDIRTTKGRHASSWFQPNNKSLAELSYFMVDGSKTSSLCLHRRMVGCCSDAYRLS